jgi:hypothetical protein
MTNSLHDGNDTKPNFKRTPSTGTCSATSSATSTATSTATSNATSIEGCATATATEPEVRAGSIVAFENIAQPGCYVCNATGHLLRIYNTFDACNWNSSFGITGRSPFTFTYVSADPCCPIDMVRQNADDWDIDCNF